MRKYIWTARDYLSFLLILMIIFGIFGNILNFIVFSRRSMRTTSTFRFLFYLTFADFLVLIVCSSDTLLSYGFEIEIRLYSLVVCRVHTFLTYFLTHLSSIILMVVSIERAIVVCNQRFPGLYAFREEKLTLLKRSSYAFTTTYDVSDTNYVKNDFVTKRCCFRLKKFFSKNRIESIILIIVIFLAIVNFHFLVYLNINELSLKKPHLNFTDLNSIIPKKLPKLNISSLLIETNLNLNEKYDYEELSQKHGVYYSCYPLPNSKYEYFLNNIWIWIDTSLYSLIPFTIMIVCTLMIAVEIRINTQKFLRSSINLNNLNRGIILRRIRRTIQMLLMLTSTNIYFVISSMPFFVVFHVYNAKIEEKEKYTTNYASLLIIVHILAYSNNSANFIFYGLFSKKYREEISIFLKFKKRQSKNNYQSKLGINSRANKSIQF
jgi:hypothetical protein